MDERKNKMTDERYREILPTAYMTAAIAKGRQPRPVEVGLLNSFAEETANGIIDFDTYVTDPEKYDGFLIYDKSNGKVVCDMCGYGVHFDIVGYYDFFDGVDIRVIEDDGIFVDVNFGRNSIVVENGRWYVSNY